MGDIDIFLSYNRVDSDEVERVRQLLEARGISTFLDQKNLVPGVPWPQELEKALKQSSAVAVFFGDCRPGNWQQREINYALERQDQEKKAGRVFPVIPVLLKRKEDPPLGFLSQNTWVDLSAGIDNGEAIAELERAIRATIAEVGPAKPSRSVCPFMGLKPFREEDSPLFFGRKEVALDLLRQVSTHKIVTLIGSSGSGKSSLVQAGLIPLLRRQRPPDDIWDVVCFSPSNRPFRHLAETLAPLCYGDLKGATLQAEAMKLAELFQKAPAEMEITLRKYLDHLMWTDHLLLVLDQFEELLQTDDTDRERFLFSLLQAQERLPLTLLFTLRADLYDRVIGLGSGLGQRFLGHPMTLYAMTREDLAKAIREPARKVGLDFETNLVEQILDDAGQEPGNLALVEVTLRSLWQERQGNKMTYQAYREIGKVTGAIADAADRVFLGCSKAEQALVRRVFTRVVRIEPPEEGGRRFRQKIPLDELSDGEQEVARRLAAAEGRRLLVLGRDGSEESVTLAHEALIQHWQRALELAE